MQEQDVRQLSPSYPLVRERERNPRVHTLDAAWKREEEGWGAIQLRTRMASIIQ